MLYEALKKLAISIIMFTSKSITAFHGGKWRGGSWVPNTRECMKNKMLRRPVSKISMIAD